MLSGETTLGPNETMGDASKLVKFSDYEKVKNENKLLESEIILLDEQIKDLALETKRLKMSNAMLMS
jgi:hypothetical protein